MTILKAFSRLYLLSILCIAGAVNSYAQLVEVPLENNLAIIDYLEKHPNHSRNNQVCAIDTLQLPFFDDFAGATSIYPNCSNWQDNHVFINTDMAYNPPSLGVATFDGLSPEGTPYNMGASLSAGSPADTLTSQCINLLGQTAGDDVYLSFFYQRQGLSDRPEVQDSFILEFKDTNNLWIEVWKVSGVGDTISTLTVPLFEQQYIKIDSLNFLHASFQFRFRNLATITGNNDHWHLDYVMLDANRANNANPNHVTYGRYADVAFTHIPTTPLANGYTAMPWRHFDANTSWADTITIQNNNLNATGGATFDRQCEIDEISPNAQSLLVEGIPAVPVYGPSPNNNDSSRYALTGTHNTLNPTEKTILETTYTILTPGGFQSNPIFTANDVAKRQTVLDNYFAYDDGTAETRVIAQGVGTKIAVEFTAGVDDTIQGVYFHLPYFTNRDAEQDFVSVQVWLDSLHSNSQVFSRDFHRLRYTYGFNGFHFVEIVDFSGNRVPIPVTAGQKFYVGWLQSSMDFVPVGFDRSTDSRSKTFVKIGTNNWINSDLKGSVLIRPLLNPDTNYTLIPVDKIEEPVNQLSIYPNPTKDVLNLELDFYTNSDEYMIYVHNAMGQTVYAAPFTQQLSLGKAAAGLYILTLRNEKGKQIAQHKIIKH